MLLSEIRETFRRMWCLIMILPEILVYSLQVPVLSTKTHQNIFYVLARNWRNENGHVETFNCSKKYHDASSETLVFKFVFIFTTCLWWTECSEFNIVVSQRRGLYFKKSDRDGNSRVWDEDQVFPCPQYLIDWVWIQDTTRLWSRDNSDHITRATVWSTEDDIHSL